MVRQKLREMETCTPSFPTIKGLSQILAVLAVFMLLNRTSPAVEEGVAVAIVYDTSGSMKESAPSGSGRTAAKYLIANKALSAIGDRLDRYATKSLSGAPRKVETGLYVFRGSSATPAVPFGPLKPGAIQNWAAVFSSPEGATPLGNSISVAGKALAKSALSHKHIVIITDGMNTSGPRPEEVIPRLRDAGTNHLSFHFVAFDVDAKVFEPVKKLGATVLGAANEEQLNSQLEYIFEQKILLEDEEPRRPTAVKP